LEEQIMTILDEIIQYKRYKELPRQMKAREPAVVQAEAALAPPPRDFVASLRGAPGVALIAEVKKASPSKGLLRPNFDPLALAQTYAANGAAAISVLTDARYFQGKLEYLTQIRQQLNPTTDHRPPTASHPSSPTPPLPYFPTPLLRKDFIFHPYQIYQARAAGADALLLIAAVLKDQEMAGLLALTHQLGMTALIEVHDQAELGRVLPLKPSLIGVNNRDLRDFSVDLNLCLRLRQHVPAEICLVAESGIHTAADVTRLANEGLDAILVGEALVKANDVAAKVRELARVNE
jgi:indole-3-glycerol phosphate synthase